MERWLKKQIRKIEKNLGVTAKTVIGISILGVLVGFLFLLNNQGITEPTVMVTSLNRGGGSGVIVSTSKTKSQVLTNAHVCDVLKNGGAITRITGERHLVAHYTKDTMHDLCMITVYADLKSSAKLASSAPKNYEKAVVSGHPRLLPNVISSGHFSSNQIIRVLTGFRPCTDKEHDSLGDVGFVCAFFGKLPIIKTYESKLITAHTMPGSSGSAVYNSAGEVSALVFANGGGYTSTVPFEYIANFLKTHDKLETIHPNYVLDSSQFLLQSKFETLAQKCKNKRIEHDIVKKTCKIVERDVKWREYEKNFNSNFDLLPTDPGSSDLSETSSVTK